MRIDVYAQYRTEDDLDRRVDLGTTDTGDTFVRAVDYINDPQIDPNAARGIFEQNASALLDIGSD
jgi:hypothetical protein